LTPRVWAPTIYEVNNCKSAYRSHDLHIIANLLETCNSLNSWFVVGISAKSLHAMARLTEVCGPRSQHYSATEQPCRRTAHRSRLSTTNPPTLARTARPLNPDGCDQRHRSQGPIIVFRGAILQCCLSSARARVWGSVVGSRGPSGLLRLEQSFDPADLGFESSDSQLLTSRESRERPCFSVETAFLL
jgi:hypothetical protein